MEAIQTRFDGYRFRSRLEARWAVFLKRLGLRYEYEQEGFDLDGIKYLPDFWLRDKKLWFEVKGQEPTDREILAMERLVKHTQKRGVICWEELIPKPEQPISTRTIFLTSTGLETNYYHWWVECPECHGIGFHDLRTHLPSICLCSYMYNHLAPSELFPRPDSEWLLDAYTEARSARFER